MMISTLVKLGNVTLKITYYLFVNFIVSRIGYLISLKILFLLTELDT